MINYYDELGLDQTQSLEAINLELSKQESVWKSRRTKAPEKATKMLSMVYEARDVFASVDAKKQYDQLLVKTTSVNDDAVDDRSVKFEKWSESAQSFLNANEFDLARTSLEKALLYIDDDTVADSFYYLAADIYNWNMDFQSALQYINQAIALNQSQSSYYQLKAQILTSSNQLSQARECREKAIAIARTNKDSNLEGKLQGIYANFLMNVYRDEDAAEVAAKEAIRLGDPDGYGADILANLEKPREIDLNNLYQVIKQYQEKPCMLNDQIEAAQAKIVENLLKFNLESCTIKSGIPEVSYSDDVKSAYKYSIILEASGEWYLCSAVHNTYETGWMEQGSPTKIAYGKSAAQSYRLLSEFDFKGSVYSSHQHTELVDHFERFYSLHLPYSNAKLIRLYRKKGQGLLDRLNEVLIEQQQQVQQKQIDDAAKAEQEKRAQTWRSQGKCQHCGGDFKGFIGKKCSACGRPKDY